jgi:Tol biopolymer transport system component
MISADGSTVAFTSYATNLVPGDTNARGDVFVNNLRTHVTSRVSLKAGGGQSQGGGIDGDVGSFEPSISADGQVVAFGSYETDLTATAPVSARNWYVYNRATHRTVFAESTVSGGPGTLGASDGQISPDGGNVVFTSADSNVVAGDTNGQQDVFIRSLNSLTSKLVSVSTDGTQSNDYSYTATAASGGKSVAFVSSATTLVPGDTNGQPDVFLRRF